MKSDKAMNQEIKKQGCSAWITASSILGIIAWLLIIGHVIYTACCLSVEQPMGDLGLKVTAQYAMRGIVWSGLAAIAASLFGLIGLSEKSGNLRCFFACLPGPLLIVIYFVLINLPNLRALISI
jgi:hypothetical protein